MSIAGRVTTSKSTLISFGVATAVGTDMLQSCANSSDRSFGGVGGHFGAVGGACRAPRLDNPAAKGYIGFTLKLLIDNRSCCCGSAMHLCHNTVEGVHHA